MATIMSRKKLIMLGMVIGSIAGGYLPVLFGSDGPMLSLLGSTVGGIIGIWIGFKFSV
jgi:MtN3 and saliva related transmembrane protein